MTRQGKAISVTSAVYAVLVAIFLAISYAVTGGGIGWEFFEAIVIAVLTLPIYVTVIAILRLIGSAERLKGAPKTRNNGFEKALNVLSLCLICVQVPCFAAALVPFFTHVRNDLLRSLCSDVASVGLFATLIGNVAVLLNRPITSPILHVVQKHSEHVTLESTCIFVTRICILVLTCAAYPIAVGVAAILERLF